MRWKGRFAKGRLPEGEKNKTEQAYADHLERLKATGDILWYEFEGMTFRLGKRCTYTPDFNVMLPDGTLEMHEVKGSLKIFQDDAKVKHKVAAEKFPFRFVVVTPRPKKDGGGWDAHD